MKSMKKFPAKQLMIVLLGGSAVVGCATKQPPPGPTPAATQAIDQAQAAISGAQAPCKNTGNAANLLAQAQQAAQAGNNAQARDLAQQAQKTAHQAIHQCYMSKARNLLAKAQNYTNLNSDQEGRLNSAQQSLQNGRGRRAYESLKSLIAELKTAHTTYSVVQGDSLWTIAGQSNTYGNPFEWPLIYKANSGKIHNPDLIFPDEKFIIHTNPIKQAVKAAMFHAKHRGGWSLAHAQQSDKDYLAGQSGQ
jgi:nucleoid-associated protein YgaU